MQLRIYIVLLFCTHHLVEAQTLFGTNGRLYEHPVFFHPRNDLEKLGFKDGIQSIKTYSSYSTDPGDTLKMKELFFRRDGNLEKEIYKGFDQMNQTVNYYYGNDSIVDSIITDRIIDFVVYQTNIVIKKVYTYTDDFKTEYTYTTVRNSGEHVSTDSSMIEYRLQMGKKMDGHSIYYYAGKAPLERRWSYAYDDHQHLIKEIDGSTISYFQFDNTNRRLIRYYVTGKEKTPETYAFHSTGYLESIRSTKTSSYEQGQYLVKYTYAFDQKKNPVKEVMNHYLNDTGTLTFTFTHRIRYY